MSTASELANRCHATAELERIGGNTYVAELLDEVVALLVVVLDQQ